VFCVENKTKRWLSSGFVFKQLKTFSLWLSSGFVFKQLKTFSLWLSSGFVFSVNVTVFCVENNSKRLIGGSNQNVYVFVSESKFDKRC
jgi:hypothetical protein